MSALVRYCHCPVGRAVQCVQPSDRRMLELRLDPDRYVFGSVAPDTYAEFLARTSGALIHEPAAADRQRLTR